MPIQYLTLANVEEVRATMESGTWSAYARFIDRQDSPIYDISGVRMTDNELWVNAGEWHHAKGYLNEEWLKPAFVYMKHRCEGCHYPPNMCCLQPQPRYRDDSFYQVIDEDFAEYLSSDEYQDNIEALERFPEGVNPRVLEV